MFCKKCKKRDACEQICADVEAELKKLNRSFKNRYFVSFFDPDTLEIIAHIQGLKYSDEVEKRDKLEKKKKRLVVLVKQLSRRQRQCVIHYYGLLTNEPLDQLKIAKRLHIRQATVARTLRRARANLRRLFRAKRV